MPSHRLEELLSIIRRLRGENGCPWDRKQTPLSLSKYLLEESAELADAIRKNDTENICEEIGDLYFILLLLGEIFSERNAFTPDDSLQKIIDKMIRRHPHVFAGTPVGSEKELKKQWERIKKEEKQG